MKAKRPTRSVSGPKRRKTTGRAAPVKAQGRAAFEEFARIVGRYVASLDPAAPPGEAGREMRRNKWPDDPEVLTFLARFVAQVLWGYERKAQAHEQVAFQFVKVLCDYSQLVNLAAHEKRACVAIAPHVLLWPVAINARPEYARQRKATLAMIRRLGVGSKHPERKFRPLRGGLAVKVSEYLAVLMFASSGFPAGGVPVLPPFSAEALRKYQGAAWKMFLEEHGEDFERHPDLARINSAQPAEARRASIRDAWEESFKTLTRQLAGLHEAGE